MILTSKFSFHPSLFTVHRSPFTVHSQFSILHSPFNLFFSFSLSLFVKDPSVYSVYSVAKNNHLAISLNPFSIQSLFLFLSLFKKSSFLLFRKHIHRKQGFIKTVILFSGFGDCLLIQFIIQGRIIQKTVNRQVVSNILTHIIYPISI